MLLARRVDLPRQAEAPDITSTEQQEKDFHARTASYP
jgi:hypothetical protein